MSGEHVLICVAWPYANGPLHLGHVAGCYLPPDIHARYERALGNRVLMVSGSDEHGTPITVTAETEGVPPQEIVDRYHAINSQALLDLGCIWEPNVDPRGIAFVLTYPELVTGSRTTPRSLTQFFDQIKDIQDLKSEIELIHTLALSALDDVTTSTFISFVNDQLLAYEK